MKSKDAKNKNSEEKTIELHKQLDSRTWLKKFSDFFFDKRYKTFIWGLFAGLIVWMSIIGTVGMQLGGNFAQNNLLKTNGSKYRLTTYANHEFMQTGGLAPVMQFILQKNLPKHSDNSYYTNAVLYPQLLGSVAGVLTQKYSEYSGLMFDPQVMYGTLNDLKTKKQSGLAKAIYVKGLTVTVSGKKINSSNSSATRLDSYWLYGVGFSDSQVASILNLKAGQKLTVGKLVLQAKSVKQLKVNKTKYRELNAAAPKVFGKQKYVIWAIYVNKSHFYNTTLKQTLESNLSTLYSSK